MFYVVGRFVPLVVLSFCMLRLSVGLHLFISHDRVVFISAFIYLFIYLFRYLCVLFLVLCIDAFRLFRYFFICFVSSFVRS